MRIAQIWGSLQAHRSVTTPDRGGGVCPTIGTTDFGLPRVVEVYETEDTAGDEDGVCRDTAGAVLRHDLPDLADPQGSGAGGG